MRVPPRGRWLRCLAGFVLGLCAAGSAHAYVIPPEPLLELGGGIEVVSGAWSATGSQWNTGRGPATLVQLSLRAGRHGEVRHSFARLVTDLAGLSVEAVLGPPREVRFDLARDAGTLRFEGRFQSGAGAGNFIFVPSAAYLSAMRSLGYQGIDADKVYTLAALDVGRSFVAELAALGYPGLPIDQLVALRIHGADPAFVRALRAEGYVGLSPEDLVALRTYGARPEFVGDLKRLGYARLDVDDLVRFRIHGVTPEFIREMQGLGYRGVAPDDLVNLRIHGVTADFVRRVNLGRATATPVARLVDLRTRGREQ
jgi:hypothetical protein